MSSHTAATRNYADQLIDAGCSAAEVARRLALPRPTVQTWARQRRGQTQAASYGPARYDFRTALEEGLTVPQAAARVGVGNTTAYRWARHDGYHKRKSLRSCAVSTWPTELAHRAGQLTREERLAVGRLCSVFGAHHVPDRADTAWFLEYRRNRLAAEGALRERRNLLSGLAKLLPDTAWEDFAPPSASEASGTGPPQRSSTRIGVPVSNWPHSQRRAWEQACDPGYIATDDVLPYAPGALARLTPDTRANMEKAYGLYLHTRQSRDQSPEITPAGVHTLVEDGCARGLTLRSLATYVDGLASVAPILEPDRDFTWLRRARNALRQDARREPKRKWQYPIIEPAVLWSLGCDLMEGAEGASTVTPRVAVKYRDGLLLAIISSAPVRLSNLAAIEIGTSLVLPENAPGTLISHRTKTGPPSRHPLWPELRAAIDVYLERYRPRLLKGADPGALWIASRTGKAMTTSAIAARIRKVAWYHLGRDLSPHRVRDAVATALMIAAPESPEFAT